MATFNQPNGTNALTLAIEGQRLSVEQTTITVNTLDDITDGDITDGSVSLRDAIALASSGDTITFANGGTIALDAALGELNIAQSLTIDGDIDGDGEGDITIDGQGNSRVLNINDGDDTATVDVALSGLTITGGRSSGGAGIFNSESLAIADSTISGNSAEFNDGGGIFNFSGTTSLTNSTVSGNSAYNNGGGISNHGGTTSLTNSTVSGNSAGLSGGGIFNSDGTTDLSNSTVSGNSSRYGGGLYNRDGTTDLSNSTVSGNSSLVGGGMINFSGTATLTNSTISGNSATDNGGGVFNFNSTTILTSTIFADNTASSGNEIYVSSGTVSADANNLFGDSSQTNATAFSGFTPGSSDVVATSDGLGIALDAILDATGLQYNSGPTKTIALAADSPAIDAGDSANIPADLADQDSDSDTSEDSPFDQRGTGFIRVIGTSVDIGAFEYQSVANTAPTITSAATVDAAENQTFAIDVEATDDTDAETSGLTYRHHKRSRCPALLH